MSTTRRATLRFTEQMKGWFAFDQTDPETGAAAGRDGSAPGGRLSFRLTIETPDVEAFLADPELQAEAVGVVECDALGGELPVERGEFNLFVVTGSHTRRMLYRLWFRDGAGHPLTFVGHKNVDGWGGITDVWPETSTLYTQVLWGHVEAAGRDDARVVGAGVLRILPLDFARQVTTFRVVGVGLMPGLVWLGRFGRLFVGQLAVVFLPHRWFR